MIDKEILDAVLPLPTLDELKEQKVEELKDEGFVISNFHSGGVFYTMLMIVLRIKVEAILPIRSRRTCLSLATSMTRSSVSRSRRRSGLRRHWNCMCMAA